MLHKKTKCRNHCSSACAVIIQIFTCCHRAQCCNGESQAKMFVQVPRVVGAQSNTCLIHLCFGHRATYFYISSVVVCGCATHGKCHARVRSTWYPVQPCAVVISGRVHPSTFRNSSTYTSCKTHHWSNHSIEKFQRPISIWAPAFIYFDDKKMWRQAGLEEMLVSPRKRDQNEMGGLQKRDTFWCLLYLSIGCYNSEVRRNWGGKKTGPKRDQNEVWTRSDHWYLRMQYKWHKINSSATPKINKHSCQQQSIIRPQHSPSTTTAANPHSSSTRPGCSAIPSSRKQHQHHFRRLNILLGGRPSKIGKWDHSWWKSAKPEKQDWNEVGGTYQPSLQQPPHK